jgi:ATP-dependent Clp protease ATP-binding subunit ClpB
VFNVLLQVLDDGRLTDGQGRTVDFKNTVIIMTSNLGSDVVQLLAGDDNYDLMKSSVMDVVSGHFRPEFINRVDEVVVFHPLSKDQLRGIANIQLALLAKRLAELDLTLRVDDAVLDRLLEAGFDPVYGARPLKRVIQRLIENPLAESILAGKFAPGVEIIGRLVEEDIVFLNTDA